MIVRLGFLERNLTEARLGSLSLYFSYSTCIAFAYDKGEVRFKDGRWPRSTMKHRQMLRGGNTGEINLPADEFDAVITEIVGRVSRAPQA
jgi:hypothetical protein